MNEIWKDIPQYEGLYQVSNYGRVKNVNTGKIKAQSIAGNGYQRVHLYKCGKDRNEYVHRLVAMAFIPNPDNLPQVNHKDEDKANNIVDNLEWCSAKYNMNYGSLPTSLSLNYPKAIQIIKCDLYGNELDYYLSINEAEKMNGMAKGSIGHYFKKHQKQCGGFTWKKID